MEIFTASFETKKSFFIELIIKPHLLMSNFSLLLPSFNQYKAITAGQKVIGFNTSAECCQPYNGGLAQLARAFAWHARGHRFDSDILHLLIKPFQFSFGAVFFVNGFFTKTINTIIS